MLLSACGSWHYTINAPLERYDEKHGYRFSTIESGTARNDIFVALTFSGGGLRAAALAYGVLERLAQERITWNGRSQRLLDEVDSINAVSGGSITAAYFALHRDGIFEHFEKRVLERSLQDEIESKIFSLSAVPRLVSPRYSRIDMVQELMDDAFFHGMTFANIPRRRPLVTIAASDMVRGSRFEFTQTYFNLICSDLDKLPVARAVAASAAVPIVFAPVTLWNYAGSCGLPASYLNTPISADPEAVLRQSHRLQEMRTYLDRNARPYIHLLDGGLTDNVGLRGITEAADMMGGFDAFLQRLGMPEAKKVVVITVNAEADGDHRVDNNADVPSIFQVARALADVPINRYSWETQLQARRAMESWQRHADPQEGLEFYLVNASISALADPEERAFLMSVPTTLQLPKDTTDRLRRAAGRLLDDSPEYRRLVESLR
ncbi:MAG TPA: patatin-like phospholipase family protein [Burkholderiales bacterium]|nr:patatin-like phospholipase family protein [Burkholderiales bacterium]